MRTKLALYFSIFLTLLAIALAATLAMPLV